MLNLSHNRFTAVPKELLKMRRLKALILNNNQIKRVKYLQNLTELNTLGTYFSICMISAYASIVLSHNPIERIGEAFQHLTSITKISLSGCQLSLADGDDDCFTSCKVTLKELRLNNNRIQRLPKQFFDLKALEILDLGGNQLETIEYAF